jgi:hypothetical protein
MAFVPLSQRMNPDPEFDGPHEGLPPWLHQSVRAWLDRQLLHGSGLANPAVLRELEATLRLKDPLAWQQGVRSAMMSIHNRMARQDGGDFALDVIDFVLARYAPGGAPIVKELDVVLVRGGSAWESYGDGKDVPFQLVRRAIGPVAEAIEDVRPLNQRAHAHLMTAWIKLMGRNPDPSSAYREAIRAVEVVAAPVVTPDDSTATLGKIIKALRDKPEKWTVDLAEATPEQVTEMAAMIWQSQFDRHGTHDESVPLNVSQEQADAAVHLAIALVRLFAGGHITRV